MNRRTVLLIGVAAVLTILVALRYLGGSEPVRPRADTDPVTPVVEIRLETGEFLPPYEAFDAISARPLFQSDRRPVVATVIQNPVTPAVAIMQVEEPRFTVIGTVTGPTGSVATIRSDGETRRVYRGDTIEGWRIDVIRQDSIDVSQSGEAFRLPIGERE